MNNYIDRALDYCESILSGEIPGNASIKKVCENFIRDLNSSTQAKWAYYFSEERANRVCQFVELMPHVEGVWDTKRIHLEGWQCLFLCNIFGMLERGSDLRRYRVIYLGVARKNAKSTLAAAIGSYCLIADGEPGAQVYSAARSKDQAKIVWKCSASQLAGRTDLCDKFGIRLMTQAITQSGENAHRTYQPVSREAKNLEGKNPHCVILDELHAHPDDEVREVMLQGMGSRKQPLLVQITTAGTDMGTFAWEEHLYAERVALGLEQNPRYFAMPYGLESDDDWKNEKLWVKANPNLGVSVSLQSIQDGLLEALAKPRKLNNFKSRRLNMWSSTTEGWLDMDSWLQCGDPTMCLEELAGRAVWLGLDLASTQDLTALSVVAPTLSPEGDIIKLEMMAYHFLPSPAVRNGHQRWAAWLREERPGLIETKTETTDFAAVRKKIEEINEIADIRLIGFDPYNATHFTNQLSEEGYDLAIVRQGVQTLSEPSKLFERAIVSKFLRHTGCPILTWQIGNAMVQVDVNENIRPIRPDRDSKIDGVVATTVALAAMTADDIATTEEPYFIDI